jgi:hypothetical protein
MSVHSRRGGIIAVLVVGVLIAVTTLVVGSVIIANNVHLQHRDTPDGARVRVETPFGDMNIDARDTLNPEAAGIPVYPGAFREHGNAGGVMFDFQSQDGRQKQFSVVTAEYYTKDSAAQVTEFYRSALPHWIFTERRDGEIKMEYSRDGYKRMIAIHEGRGRTNIGIAALGEPGVN